MYNLSIILDDSGGEPHIFYSKEFTMKRRMITLLAALSMAALVSGGCANNEVVKKEETAPVTAKAEATKAEAAKVEQAKAEQIKAEATKPVEQPITKNEETKIEAAKASNAATAVTAVSAFETVYFDYDKSDLRQDARNILSKNAEILLKSKTDAKLKIEGHCDERGSAEYNLALGERRAKSALQYLLTLGVQADRLSVISFGKEKPAVQGNDEAAWTKNRRAEFVIDK
jgi:peptidoglycan-associated lipoprotein